MITDTLKHLIETYVQLPPHANSGGWYPVLCKVCNDHGRKGPRAGFRFDTESIGYHCFNCGTKSIFEGEHLSKNMEKILVDFDIPQDEINRIKFTLLGTNKSNKQTEATVENINPPKISLPDHFYPIADAYDTDKWAEVAKLYLEDRLIDWKDYPFYLSSDKDWIGRIIIPIYKNNQLIFYQGRDMTGKRQKKYHSPSVQKDKVLYGFDRLFATTEAPLYICEGFFDAHPIDGVAILGNDFTKHQIAWLNRSRRTKVYVPDTRGNGGFNAHAALDNGWKISIPDIGNCKDVSEGIVRYGKLYVLSSLRDNTCDGFEARTKITLLCKRGANDKKRSNKSN